MSLPRGPKPGTDAFSTSVVEYTVGGSSPETIKASTGCTWPELLAELFLDGFHDRVARRRRELMERALRHAAEDAGER